MKKAIIPILGIIVILFFVGLTLRFGAVNAQRTRNELIHFKYQQHAVRP